MVGKVKVGFLVLMPHIISFFLDEEDETSDRDMWSANASYHFFFLGPQGVLGYGGLGF